MSHPESSTELHLRGSALIQRLADGCAKDYGFGSMSPAIYDTAWVSMVSKNLNGITQWVFPQCFQYLVDNQLPDGSWGSHGSDVDGILNTMAALLALKRHDARPDCRIDSLPDDIGLRIAKANDFLENTLQRWDVGSSRHVGFEILIPSLLASLEGEALPFEFPGRRCLMSLNEKKLAKFDARMLYAKTRTTLVHSLEAFVGKVDYDKVSHHKVLGSMMASPASTAVYLMNTSVWDHEAEDYIRTVVAHGEGKGTGGVPSAFPTTIFELSWVVSTLLGSGYSLESLGIENLDKIADFLGKHLQKDGLVGFAPDLLADADDTAKTISTLSLLHRPVLPSQMILEFEAETHFRTYSVESNASFSANCNVLNALLWTPKPSTYVVQISKTANYLCNTWWDGLINDKWNLSPGYPMMLLGQALMRLLRIWDRGELASLPNRLVQDRITVVLFQILTRTLDEMQRSNESAAPGKWCEETAYAVLTLVSISSLPWASSLEPQITSAIQKGRQLLDQQCENWTPANVWIEKVTYSSAVLSEAYCLAAINIPLDTRSWGNPVLSLMNIPTQEISKFSQFFNQLPLFSMEPDWKLRCSLLEGCLFLPQLERIKLDIFSREKLAKDTYMTYIPFTWTLSNNLEGAFLSAKLLWEMMVLSMLNYQVDEYMEAVIGVHFENNLAPVRQMIRRLCKDPGMTSHASRERPYAENDRAAANGHRIVPAVPNGLDSVVSLVDIEKTLGRFTYYVLNHPKVQQAVVSEQHVLEDELQTFLLAHLDHIEDNTRFSRQELSSTTIDPFLTPRGTYYDWVHTTSADHTSCPYSFVFFSCLIAPPGTMCYPGVESKYIAQDLCRHLATMCRQYNDYGSIARDRAERNLNSVNFPELHDCGTTTEAGQSPSEQESRIKSNLFKLMEYERECLLSAMKNLEEMVPASISQAFKLFVNVTDSYGQIYVARDIASRMR